MLKFAFDSSVTDGVLFSVTRTRAVVLIAPETVHAKLLPVSLLLSVCHVPPGYVRFTATVAAPSAFERVHVIVTGLPMLHCSPPLGDVTASDALSRLEVASDESRARESHSGTRAPGTYWTQRRTKSPPDTAPRGAGCYRFPRSARISAIELHRRFTVGVRSNERNGLRHSHYPLLAAVG